MDQVGRARKKITAALDGLRNNLQNVLVSSEEELDMLEKLGPEQCCLSRLVKHGFPHDPRSLAFDSVQKICAIGAARGCIRILGQAGVDHLLKHNSDATVTHLQFLINEGGLVSVLNNDSIHLWNFRQKTPEIVHSVQLNRERVSALYLPLQNKWLYVGTDKGNVYFIRLATFELSSYVVNWNKAIDLSCKVHPGSIRLLSTCPTEPSKLLIVFKKGIVGWNLLTRDAERFGSSNSLDSQSVTTISTDINWDWTGRQFMCGHTDGSLTIWNVKKPGEVVHKTTPHSPSDSSVQCRPITHLIWNSNSNNEQLIIFAGGMPQDDCVLPSITILRAKGSLTVLEMDYSIVSVLPMLSSPFSTVPQYPYALAVLLKNDFLIVDLTAQGYPCFESPHPMDIHESLITHLRFYADCPVDLIAALTLVGRNQRRQGAQISNRNWPISGGIGRDCATGCQEMLLTGHEDGSIKFWQASGEQLQLMYKLKTGRHFEKNSAYLSHTSYLDENADKAPPVSVSHAISLVELCLDSRLLLVASLSGQVTLFRFAKSEGSQEIAVVVLSNLNYVNVCSEDLSDIPAENRSHNEGKGDPSQSSHSTDTSVQVAEQIPIKVRGGALRRPAGYQPELVCMIPWNNGQAEQVAAVALNSINGIIAISSAIGLAVVDIESASMICAWSNSDIYCQTAVSFLSDISLGQNSTDKSSSADPFVAASSPSSKDVPKLVISAKTPHISRLNTTDSSGQQRPPLTKAFTFNPTVSITPEQEVHSPIGHNNCNSHCDGNLHESAALSRSSSTNSIAKASLLQNDLMTFMTFINSCSKNGPNQPTLWVGSASGMFLALNIMIPINRITAQVNVTFSGNVLQLSGHAILSAFMDLNFCLTVAQTEIYHEAKDSVPATANVEKHIENRIITKVNCAPTVANNGEQGKTKSFPSEGVLQCVSCAGSILVFTLPSLKAVFQTSLFPFSIEIDDPICQRFDISENGMGIYMASPSEVVKFTMSSELATQIYGCSGELFIPCDMPEPPKSSFLREVSSLFTAGIAKSDTIDLDAIFGEKPSTSAATMMKTVAKPITSFAQPSTTSMNQTKGRSLTAGQAVQLAMQNLDERNERLGAVADATDHLRNNAQNLQSRAAKLVDKYEKKKWYQF